MGLKETFQKAAETAVTAFGNVGVSTVYAAFASTSYNASAGTQVATFTSVAGVTMIFEDFTLREIDTLGRVRDIEPTDKKALIPAAGPLSTVTPALQDTIRDPDGTTWKVVNAEIDAADALWVLHVRK